MSEAVWQAMGQVLLDPSIWVIILLAAFYGMFVGAIPGLTATMATALMVPLTFWLEPLPALAAIVTMVACAIFAGDIPTILIRMPGTPASAAYADAAHTLTNQGRSRTALNVALMSSIIGGLLGALALILIGQWLAGLAAWFSVAEYFWLYLLGLSTAVVISQGSLLKGLFALMIGLLLSTVGLSAVHTESRFTFGQPELYQGVNFIPAMIGLFGVSEVLRNLLNLDQFAGTQGSPSRKPREGASNSLAMSLLHRMVQPVVQSFKTAVILSTTRLAATIRSSVVGTLIGILPGAGADIASWVAMAVGRRSEGANPPDLSPIFDLDKTHDESSRSRSDHVQANIALNGLSNASNANNASLAGSWIPALVFGIPGDSVTAIVLGVLLMKNIQPGPEIFTAQADLVYGLYTIFFVANLVMWPIGLLAIALGNRVVSVPRRVLLPIILLYCVIGSYAINGSVFDVGIMFVMGLVGFLLERRSVPLGPIVLGIILGGPLEERFIQTATGAGGSLLGFVDRPVAAILGASWLLLWVSMIIRELRHHGRSPAVQTPGESATDGDQGRDDGSSKSP